MDDLSSLIDKAQEGDKDAFGQIYQLFYKRIYRYCRYNTRDQIIAQDLCQETFLRAWRSISGFSHNKGGSFQAYLFKIAHNLIVDLSRKKKEVSINFYEDTLETDQNLDENIQRQEDIKKIRSALSKLEQKERQIVVLRYFEEMTSAEVARILKIHEGALRVRTHRILKKLKDVLQGIK